MSSEESYYILDPKHTNPSRMRKERDKARKLKKSQWWLDLLQKGLCHFCHQKFPAPELTLDHVVPLARGGASTRGNCVPSCKKCNQDKKLQTPVEQLLELLKKRMIPP